MHTQADISESEKQLEYHPQVTLEQGIKAYVPEIKRLFEEVSIDCSICYNLV